MQYVGVARWGTHQSKAYSATAGTIDTAITAGVTRARIVVTTAAYVKVGKGVTATSADVYMAADSPEYVIIREGEVVSAIRVTSDGTLHVTEVA